MTAERFQVDAKTVRKWRDRFLAEGDDGLLDRSSRPHRSPNRHRRAVHRQVLRLRRKRRWGADRIAFEVGIAASTVQRILRAEGCADLDRGDRATDRAPVRATSVSGRASSIHVDVKKIAAIPDGGGWRRPRQWATKASSSATAATDIAISTAPSMTAPGSSTPRSSTTNKPSPPPRSGFEPQRGSPTHGDQLRTRHHRQRCVLPIGSLAPRLQRDWHRREEDATAPTANQRQDRALPPHPARGMGLHPALDLRTRTRARLPTLHPLLQSPPTPRRARLGNTSRNPNILGDNLPAEHS